MIDQSEETCESIWERSLRTEGLAKWSIAKSRSTGSWYALAPGPLGHTAGDDSESLETHAEALDYAWSMIRKELSAFKPRIAWGWEEALLNLQEVTDLHEKGSE